MVFRWCKWTRYNSRWCGRRCKRRLTTPPPNERSQFPMRVLATIRGMVSGCAQPTASIAMATCASGILSSRTRIWRGDRQNHPDVYPLYIQMLIISSASTRLTASSFLLLW